MFSTLYPEEMLRALPPDKFEANDLMLKPLEAGLNEPASRAHIVEMINAMEVYQAFRESRGMAFVEFDWKDNHGENINTIRHTVEEMRHQHDTEATKLSARATFVRSAEFFKMQSGAMFCYEFTDEDIDKIQKWLNELRGLITKAEQLDEDHRSRLLKRLEQLQAELHKKLSDLDRFWGLVGDAGVAINKFGDDTKAVRRLIYAVTAIIVKVQSFAHGLPAPDAHPLLPSPDAFDESGTIEV